MTKLHGVKYNDLNGNGVRDAGEPGLAGWTIVLQAADGTIIKTETDANGEYWFMDLPAGNYRVYESHHMSRISPTIPDAPWTQTQPSSATHNLSLAAGQVIDNLDFGNTQQGKMEYCHLGWDVHYPDSGPILAAMIIYNESGQMGKMYDVTMTGLPAGSSTSFGAVT